MLVWDTKKMQYDWRRWPRPRKKGHPKGMTAERKEKLRVLGALKAAGVPDAQALTMAGYSPKNRAVLAEPVVQETVAQVRERMQGMPGFGLEDSAKFYAEMSENAATDANKIKARTRLDDVLGYDASKKVEVSETHKHDLNVAVGFLSNLNVNPMELMKSLAVDGEIEAEGA